MPSRPLWTRSTPTRRPEHWPGFWAVFGFVGCVVIILVSKWFGHLGIMTREDYYEDGVPSDRERRSSRMS